MIQRAYDLINSGRISASDWQKIHSASDLLPFCDGDMTLARTVADIMFIEEKRA